jgi:hypothetical protein
LHRLITTRGELRGGEDEENFGENLTQYVGSVDDSTVQRTLPAKVIAELRKDEQVDNVVVTLESTKASNGETTWSIAIDVESAVGPFQLVLSVDSVTTKLLGITT